MFVVLFVFIVVMNSSNVYALYNVDTKENWRGVAKYINENIQSGDIILLNAPYMIQPFNYYYNGYAEAKGVNTIEELKVITPEYERIWLILSHQKFTDPKGDIQYYLNATAHEITGKKFTGINVSCYEVRKK